jgi:ABC-2 type transport system ATP-binding protein
MIEAVGLRKTFGRVVALNGLDVTLDSGQVAAILGPNGAGKTTFLRTISTLIRPDEGLLSVEGIDVLAHPAKIRQIIGLAVQYATVDEAQTGQEYLVMIARLFGQDRRTARASAEAVLDRLHLRDDADRLVRTYSGGMRRRLDLGASLVGGPRLLLLDEPTAGLDPESRLDMWDTIRSLTDEGTDVLLTTQYLEEADRLARMITIIDHGRVIASGTAQELKSRVGHDVIEVHVLDRDDLTAAAAAFEQLGAETPHADAGSLVVSVSVVSGSDRLMQAVQSLTERGVRVADVGLRRPTLDEVFLTLTRHSASADVGRRGGDVKDGTDTAAKTATPTRGGAR